MEREEDILCPTKNPRVSVSSLSADLGGRKLPRNSMYSAR